MLSEELDKYRVIFFITLMVSFLAITLFSLYSMLEENTVADYKVESKKVITEELNGSTVTSNVLKVEVEEKGETKIKDVKVSSGVYETIEEGKSYTFEVVIDFFGKVIQIEYKK